jgi:hypothetical protein
MFEWQVEQVVDGRDALIALEKRGHWACRRRD